MLNMMPQTPLPIYRGLTYLSNKKDPISGVLGSWRSTTSNRGRWLLGRTNPRSGFRAQ